MLIIIEEMQTLCSQPFTLLTPEDQIRVHLSTMNELEFEGSSQATKEAVSCCSVGNMCVLSDKGNQSFPGINLIWLMPPCERSLTLESHHWIVICQQLINDWIWRLRLVHRRHPSIPWSRMMKAGKVFRMKSEAIEGDLPSRWVGCDKYASHRLVSVCWFVLWTQ